MNNTRSGYLLGIGSNINPDDNIARIIELLLKSFSTINLSRILRCPPVRINSNGDFLNAVAFIRTSITELELKNICNNIETKLGRNRNSPARKIRDRTADLDILATVAFPDDKFRFPASITDEYFLYPLIYELFAFLSGYEYKLEQSGVSIDINGLLFGQTATTIHRDTGTGNKGVR